MPDTATRPLPQLEAPNLAAAVRLYASARPDRVALIERAAERRSLTWAEFDRAVDACAQGLAVLGARAGQPVLLAMANTTEMVTVWFAALRAGVIATPINPAATGRELRRIASHSQAALLIGDPKVELPGVRIVAPAELTASAGHARLASPLDEEAIGALVYTSGSSGQPKGAMLSHRALIAHCEASWRRGVIESDAVALCCLPLFHAFGLNAVLGAAVYAGATIVLVDGLPDDLPEILAAEQVTHLPLTPSALYRLSLRPGVGDACAGVRLVTSGAAPLSSAIATNWRRLTGLPVHQGYGLTEAGPGVATTVGGECRSSTHVGRALPGVEIRIGDGSQPGEPAEVWIRGRNLFSGYWPDGVGGPDADGWFATGDIGYLDGPELFLVDRVRELIIVSGFNVYPSEIEEVLTEHPDVVDAAVLGQPDDRTGERVIAFVTGDAVDAPALLAYAATKLARYKMPAEVMLIKAMPRSSAGKIRKNLLRDMMDMTDEGDL